MASMRGSANVKRLAIRGDRGLRVFAGKLRRPGLEIAERADPRWRVAARAGRNKGNVLSAK
jgi:hypothetical protein